MNKLEPGREYSQKQITTSTADLYLCSDNLEEGNFDETNNSVDGTDIVPSIRRRKSRLKTPKSEETKYGGVSVPIAVNIWKDGKRRPGQGVIHGGVSDGRQG